MPVFSQTHSEYQEALRPLEHIHHWLLQQVTKSASATICAKPNTLYAKPDVPFSHIFSWPLVLSAAIFESCHQKWLRKRHPINKLALRK